MDYISLPFSYEQISELLDLCPTDHDHHLEQNPPPIISPNTSDTNKPSKEKKKLKSTTPSAPKNVEDVNEIKKIMHRDVERRRRKEMTTLCRTLRQELPMECLKGKRSAADHIHETVGYIEVLQKRIEKLNEKKDKLMRPNLISNPGSPKASTNGHIRTVTSPQTSVEVKSSMNDLKVLISTNVNGGVNLSGVLSIVSGEEGLSVVNCISARVHSRMLHTLHIQVNEGENARAVDLQRKIIAFGNRNMSK